MAYVALYRTYRPKTFKEVAGQEHITKTLMNALKNEKISHAYLFSGPRGTGKTSIAKIFAKAVNCEHYPTDDPCNECSICKGINQGTISDVIEIDAASNNGVDEIREIRDKVKYVPSVCRYKVYIIDEVHMLSQSAFNALLKTLEEPPKHAIFILATTEAHKIPATILSRCQRFDFRAISNDEIKARLKEVSKAENIDITDEAIDVIANNSEGGLRDALSLLDQAMSYANGQIDEQSVHKISGSVATSKLIDLVSALIVEDSATSMALLDDLVAEGKEVSRIVSDLITFFKNILLYKNVVGYEFQSSVYRNEKFIKLAKALNNARVYLFISILNEVQGNIKWSNQKKAYLELGIIKMCDKMIIKPVEDNELLYDLEKRIIVLEKKPVEKVIEKVVETPVLKEVKYDDQYDMISKIIDNPNKEKRILMQSAWGKLDNISDPELKIAAKLLHAGDLVAMNDYDMILVYDDNYKCQQVMKDSNKDLVKKILNRKQHLISDYVAITKEQWEKLKEEYLQQKKSGKKISLGETVEINVNQGKHVDEFDAKTIEFFGKEKVKFEE